MSQYILDQQAAREEAWGQTVVESSPALSEKLGTLEAQQAKLASESAELKAAALDAADRIAILIEQRGDLQARKKLLAALESDVAQINTTSATTLDAFILAKLTGDNYAMQRFEVAALSVAKLKAIEPALPAFKKQNADALDAVEAEISSTAKTHAINLPVLLGEMQPV